MDRPSPSVVPASMQPPLPRLSNATRNESPSYRGQTPSERSSTSSRSRRDTCYLCSSSSAYDNSALVACCLCKRKYHRGCHKPLVPRNCPPDWKCYFCNSSKIMQPATKKRKLGSSKFSGATNAPSHSISDRKEIFESPQEQLSPTKGTASKPTYFMQPPRFAPFFSKAEEQSPINTSVQKPRLVQHPKFASANKGTKDHRLVDSTDPTPKAVLKGEVHSVVNPDPTGIYEQTSQEPKTKIARPRKRPNEPSCDDLIGMALHEAPDCRLGIEGIYEWIIHNVPGYKSKDVSWKSGVWVTLSASRDFIPQFDRSQGESWTFSDGACEKYGQRRRSTGLSSTASSSQDASGTQKQLQQGVDTLERSVEALTPNHEIMRIKTLETPINQITFRTDRPAGSEILSALPSTVEETLEVIDLTTDDGLLLPPPEWHKPDNSTTGKPVVSLLQETLEDVFNTSPNDKQLSDRSGFIAFGEPVWKPRTTVKPRPESSTPMIDNLFKNLSRERLENLRKSEEFKAATRKVDSILKSPNKTKVAQDSPGRSPTSLQKQTSSDSPSLAPAASPNNRDLRLYLEPPETLHEPMLHDSDIEMQNQEPLHDKVNLEETVQNLSTVNELSAVPAPKPPDRISQLDLDLQEEFYEPTLLESEPLVPAQTQSDRVIQSEWRSPQEPVCQEPVCQEPVHQEPAYQEPVHQESLLQEPPAKVTPLKTYMDSAAQTTSSAISAFALEKITHKSLEPHVPAIVATSALPTRSDTSTQTENLSEPKIASRPLQSTPEVQLPTPQSELDDSPPLKENEQIVQDEFEKECLSLLDEMMYPTKPSTPNWPSHFKPRTDPFLSASTPLSSIRTRPTRKQIFGKVELSRVAGNDALTTLNKIQLGGQNVRSVELGKGYTEKERAREKELNGKDGYYDTLEELLNMPQQVVPFIHDQQLAFRDYVPNALGRVGRPRVIYKIGSNAK